MRVAEKNVETVKNRVVRVERGAYTTDYVLQSL
jgi:hypothetical protein